MIIWVRIELTRNTYFNTFVTTSKSVQSPRSLQVVPYTVLKSRGLSFYIISISLLRDVIKIDLSSQLYDFVISHVVYIGMR